MNDHSPSAVRAEFEGWDRFPAAWLRGARRGCDGCTEWDTTRARLRALHATYRRRASHRTH